MTVLVACFVLVVAGSACKKEQPAAPKKPAVKTPPPDKPKTDEDKKPAASMPAADEKKADVDDKKADTPAPKAGGGKGISCARLVKRVTKARIRVAKGNLAAARKAGAKGLPSDDAVAGALKRMIPRATKKCGELPAKTRRCLGRIGWRGVGPKDLKGKVSKCMTFRKFRKVFGRPPRRPGKRGGKTAKAAGKATMMKRRVPVVPKKK